MVRLAPEASRSPCQPFQRMPQLGILPLNRVGLRFTLCPPRDCCPNTPTPDTLPVHRCNTLASAVLHPPMAEASAGSAHASPRSSKSSAALFNAGGKGRAALFVTYKSVPLVQLGDVLTVTGRRHRQPLRFGFRCCCLGPVGGGLVVDMQRACGVAIAMPIHCHSDSSCFDSVDSAYTAVQPPPCQAQVFREEQDELNPQMSKSSSEAMKCWSS